MVTMFRLMIFCVAMLSPPGSAIARDAAPEYRGDDGGFLVYAVGTIAIGMRFDFPY